MRYCSMSFSDIECPNEFLNTVWPMCATAAASAIVAGRILMDDGGGGRPFGRVEMGVGASRTVILVLCVVVLGLRLELVLWQELIYCGLWFKSLK